MVANLVIEAPKVVCRLCHQVILGSQAPWLIPSPQLMRMCLILIIDSIKVLRSPLPFKGVPKTIQLKVGQNMIVPMLVVVLCPDPHSLEAGKKKKVFILNKGSMLTVVSNNTGRKGGKNNYFKIRLEKSGTVLKANNEHFLSSYAFCVIAPI